MPLLSVQLVLYQPPGACILLQGAALVNTNNYHKNKGIYNAMTAIVNAMREVRCI